MALIARLVTACGCTRDQIISEELPVLRVAISHGHPPYWLDATGPAIVQTHSVREFGRGRVITDGEGSMYRMVEYRERVEPVRPSAPAPQAPYVRVVQTQPNGQQVRLNVVRHDFMPGASEMTVEVAGALLEEDIPSAPLADPGSFREHFDQMFPGFAGITCEQLDNLLQRARRGAPTGGALARALHSPSVRQTVTEILEGESHNRQEHS